VVWILTKFYHGIGGKRPKKPLFCGCFTQYADCLKISFMRRFLLSFAALYALALLPVIGQVKPAEPEIKEPKKANSRPTPTPEPPPAEPFDKADAKTMAAQCAELVTEKGVIDIELYPEMAPETVRNFLNLVAIGAYDTTVFSRVVPGFVIQGGNLATRETATIALVKRSHRTIPDEPNKVLHERGVVSMARSDEPNSASTHFFILVDAAPTLDGKFAAFGRITRGMDVVDTINKMPVIGDKPEKPVRVKKASTVNCATSSSNP
jgi:peptidyl-prolyl cis-trans isomerase B (cyclophilin B)